MDLAGNIVGRAGELTAVHVVHRQDQIAPLKLALACRIAFVLLAAVVAAKIRGRDHGDQQGRAVQARFDALPPALAPLDGFLVGEDGEFDAGLHAHLPRQTLAEVRDLVLLVLVVEMGVAEKGGGDRS